MQCGRVEARDIQTVRNGVGIALAAVHYGSINRDIAQQVVKQAIFVRQIVHKVHALFDVFVLCAKHRSE